MARGGNHIGKKVIFFRWSRKSFAVFNSLDKQVIIRRLSVSISNSFYAKKDTSLNSISKQKRSENKSSDEGQGDIHIKSIEDFWLLFNFLDYLALFTSKEDDTSSPNYWLNASYIAGLLLPHFSHLLFFSKFLIDHKGQYLLLYRQWLTILLTFHYYKIKIIYGKSIY